MTNHDIAIIMAGGVGMNLKSGMPSVMADVMGKPMIARVTTAVVNSNIKNIIVVVPARDNFISECLKSLFPNKEIHTVEQTTPLGTAHAVMQAKKYIEESAINGGNAVILNGDTPFMDANTICAAYSSHINFKNVATVITALVSKPFGYGRIIRDEYRKFNGIVEEQDANSDVKRINEISSGTFWFSSKVLLNALNILNPRKNGHYNLVDVISNLVDDKMKVDTFFAPRSDIVLGANNRFQLMELNEYAQKQELEHHLSLGVDIPFSDGVIIEPGVVIGMDSTILPNTIIKGNTTIGNNCIIGPNTIIYDSTIEDDVVLNNVHCSSSIVKCGASVGPFVNIPSGSIVERILTDETVVDIKS